MDPIQCIFSKYLKEVVGPQLFPLGVSVDWGKLFSPGAQPSPVVQPTESDKVKTSSVIGYTDSFIEKYGKTTDPILATIQSTPFPTSPAPQPQHNAPPPLPLVQIQKHPLIQQMLASGALLEVSQQPVQPAPVMHAFSIDALMRATNDISTDQTTEAFKRPEIIHKTPRRSAFRPVKKASSSITSSLRDKPNSAFKVVRKSVRFDLPLDRVLVSKPMHPHQVALPLSHLSQSSVQQNKEDSKPKKRDVPLTDQDEDFIESFTKDLTKRVLLVDPEDKDANRVIDNWKSPNRPRKQAPESDGKPPSSESAPILVAHPPTPAAAAAPSPVPPALASSPPPALSPEGALKAEEPKPEHPPVLDPEAICPQEVLEQVKDLVKKANPHGA